MNPNLMHKSWKQLVVFCENENMNSHLTSLSTQNWKLSMLSFHLCSLVNLFVSVSHHHCDTPSLCSSLSSPQSLCSSLSSPPSLWSSLSSATFVFETFAVWEDEVNKARWPQEKTWIQLWVWVILWLRGHYFYFLSGWLLGDLGYQEMKVGGFGRERERENGAVGLFFFLLNRSFVFLIWFINFIN